MTNLVRHAKMHTKRQERPTEDTPNQSVHSAKRLWSYIKSLKVDTIGIPTLTKDHQTELDNKLKAEILND